MDFFKKTKTIKLLSNHRKYLVASDDGSTVRQSSRPSEKSHWQIETVDHNPGAIRIKNILHEKYLMASNAAFLLGMTGSRVLLTTLDNSRDPAIEWEPIKEGFHLKLKAFGGTFLRANGGTPPWRGTVTHDKPATDSTRKWVLWGVEAAEGAEVASGYLSTASSFSSDGSEIGSPASVHSSPRFSFKKSGMDHFHNAKVVRLRSHHMKYLYAEDDEETVKQDKDGASRNARWMVELIDGVDDVVRLKSCYGKYLTASDHPFLLGMTGRKVIQTAANRGRDPAIEWVPIGEGNQVKLKTRYGNYLRANGGPVPPWRNTVTHDVPNSSSTQDWVLWEIHVVEIVVRSAEEYYEPKQESTPITPSASPSLASKNPPSVHAPKPTRFAKQESRDSTMNSPPKPKMGRAIYYQFADENGKVDKGAKELCIDFEGNRLNDLARKFEIETGIEDLIVCSRSPYNQKLYPIRLQLPPNNDEMHLVLVDPSSQFALDLEKAGLL